MNKTEIIAFVLSLSVYALIGLIIAKNVYDRLTIDPEYAMGGEKVISYTNIRFVKFHTLGLSLIVGMLWLYYIALIAWAEIGTHIYDIYIIEDDEEDRIASWVV